MDEYVIVERRHRWKIETLKEFNRRNGNIPFIINEK